MNYGVINMSITTINMIRPELETELLLLSSFLSILIQKS